MAQNLFTGVPSGSSLNADDYNYFQTAKRRVNQTYDLGAAQNQYQRNVLDSDYGNQKAQLAWQYDQMKRQIPGRFAKAGTLNSGLYSNAWDTYRANRNFGTGDMVSRYNQSVQGLDLARNQLLSTKDNALTDVLSQEAARKAAADALRAAAGVGF